MCDVQEEEEEATNGCGEWSGEEVREDFPEEAAWAECGRVSKSWPGSPRVKAFQGDSAAGARLCGAWSAMFRSLGFILKAVGEPGVWTG